MSGGTVPPATTTRWLYNNKNEEGEVEMLIQINDQFRIKSDSMQWMIQRRRTRNGKPSCESKLFFPTLQGAMNELGELMVRESEAQTLVDALADVEKVTTTLSQAVRGQFGDVLDPQNTEGQG